MSKKYGTKDGVLRLLGVDPSLGPAAPPGRDVPSSRLATSRRERFATPRRPHLRFFVLLVCAAVLARLADGHRVAVVVDAVVGVDLGAGLRVAVQGEAAHAGTSTRAERRDALLSYVVDLYADDLDRSPNAVSLEHAHMDRSGYYALARLDPANHNYPKERQLDFYGGLRWRFEEHVPWTRRKIDRISLFKTRRGLTLRPDFTFNEDEMNTYACPWHNNLTAAVCSFRTAKA